MRLLLASLLCCLLMLLSGPERPETNAEDSDRKPDQPASRPTFSIDRTNYEKLVKPFFQSHCVGCHGPEVQEGHFRVDMLSPDLSERHVAEKWHELVNRINKGEMPPKDEPVPDIRQQAAVTDWIAGQLALATRVAQSTGGQLILRRMNREEYNNTIRDLVGIDFKPAKDFPEDPPAFGFDNIGSALSISPLHFEKYMTAAREIVDRAIVPGEKPESYTWHLEVEAAHPSNQFEGRKSAGASEKWTDDPHQDRHRYILKGGGVAVQDGWLIKKSSKDEGDAGFRWFKIPEPGNYLIRIRAASRIPDRKEVEASIQALRWERQEEKLRKQNKTPEEIVEAKSKWMAEEWPQILEQVHESFFYNYGAPRMKLADGNRVILDEISIDAPLDQPQVYKIRHEFQLSGRELATITIDNSYSVPRNTENFWFLSDPDFARPELWIDWLELEGPYVDDWPLPAQQRILFASADRDDETARAREILKRFMTRAFRRPLEADELDQMLDLFQQVRPAKPGFEEAIKVPLIAVLCSPHFLYLVEPADEISRRELNQYELASRLSYFLWSSMPDEELFQLAASEKLNDERVLREQARRMLADEKSEAFVKNFAGQWLGLRQVGANPPGRDLFPRYDDHLQESIVRESEAFFGEILHKDLDVMNFVQSDFVMINNRLARFYEIPGIEGDQIRKVRVTPRQHRGGILTQASVLTITSNGTRTSPVTRGKWILENVLGDPPPPPPPDAGDIKPKVPGIDKATVRVRLEHHREIPACASCHAKIDPLGFALENFNADGSWRDREGFGYQGRVGRDDPQVDASGWMPDGTKFQTFEEFQSLLVQQDEAFLECLIEKMTTYALGRGIEFSDADQLAEFRKNMQNNGRTLRGLIEDIVTSQLFLTK